MNIAVLSDIHSNHTALEACLDSFKNKEIDAYIFLGDYIGEFPCPERTLDKLYALQKEMPCYILRGNKEEYQMKGIGGENPAWDPYLSTIGMIRYGFRHTRETDLSYFEKLPTTMRVEFEGLPALRICHGSPRAVREDIIPGNSVNEEIFAEVEEDYILCGHTHRVVRVKEYGKNVLNPGSVGLSLDGSGCAQCMILHGKDGTWEPEFLSVPYDISKAIDEMKSEKLYELAPYWTKVTESLLTGGVHSHGEVLAKAMALCEEQTGVCNWPEIPESIWKQAYEEIIF